MNKADQNGWIEKGDSIMQVAGMSWFAPAVMQQMFTVEDLVRIMSSVTPHHPINCISCSATKHCRW